MGLFSRRRERPLEGGIAGTARVLASEFIEPESDGQGGDRYSTWDEVSRAFDLGRQPYRLRLEIRTDIHAAYEVEGLFKVPRKAESPRLWKQDRIRTGLELPVRVNSSDPMDVDVDWARFMADPEREEKMRKVEETMREVTLRRHAQRDAVMTWAVEVRKGRMSREEFESAVEDEVDKRGLDPAVAEAARRKLD